MFAQSITARHAVPVPNPEAVWLSSSEASARLGGKRARARLYSKEDVERLRTRHVARSGHGPVAASALRWGEPVLETRISDVGPDGPRYRGHSAVELCRAGVSFERVAELLWTGTLPEVAGPAAHLGYDAAQIWSLFAGRASLP